MSQHRKPSGNWYFKFKPYGAPLVSGYGYATRELAAAAESAARRAAQAGKVEQLRAILAPAAVVTVGELAAEWIVAGYARPNRRPRTASQQTTQATFLGYLLEWWGSRNAETITGPALGDYAEWRRLNVRTGSSGDRTIDVELGVLSNLYQWAIAVGRAKSNPFATRPRFQASDDIDHCHQFQPESDDELHALCGWLMGQPAYAVHGAQLLFQALTGLRPGEPGLLRWKAEYAAGIYGPGHRRAALYDGRQQELLAVARLKRGQNPTVVVHDALAAFLAAWKPYCAARWPDSPWYFPNPHNPAEPLVKPSESGRILNTPLAAAAEHCKVGPRHGHAMRAYHVRVLRSQGVLDATIAARLGQSGGARLIEDIYGKPTDSFGDGRFDFWPDPTGPVKPAWDNLMSHPSNIIAL